MKKLRMALIALAFAGGIGAALGGSTLQAPCENEQQYILMGTVFVPASADFVCIQSSPAPVCTYYRSSIVPMTYTICNWGRYVDLTALSKK